MSWKKIACCDVRGVAKGESNNLNSSLILFDFIHYASNSPTEIQAQHLIELAF